VNLAKIRLFDALSISYAFHFIVIAIAWAGLILLNKKSPEPEKVRMAILLQPAKSEKVPLQYPIQKIIPPTPTVEQKQFPTPIPIKTPVLAPTKPTITAPHPTPIVSPVSVPKAVESIPVAIPKASPPPPPPKIEENYAEENLGRIRTILAERLRYPKNALRLKQQGECIVTFSLGADREVSQITITQSSGFDLLDDAAKALIETSASEFPKPKKPVRISVPIAYKLR
jgi:periplasmic protein TonB